MRQCRFSLMILLATAGITTAGCGDFAALKIEDVQTVRLRDDHVNVSVILKSNGTKDWSPLDQYCISVTWFTPGQFEQPGEGQQAEPTHYDEDSDTLLETTEDCFVKSIPIRQTVTHQFISRNVVPTPDPEGTPIWITVGLRLGTNVAEETKLVLRGPMTVESK